MGFQLPVPQLVSWSRISRTNHQPGMYFRRHFHRGLPDACEATKSWWFLDFAPCSFLWCPLGERSFWNHRGPDPLGNFQISSDPIFFGVHHKHRKLPWIKSTLKIAGIVPWWFRVSPIFLGLFQGIMANPFFSREECDDHVNFTSFGQIAKSAPHNDQAGLWHVVPSCQNIWKRAHQKGSCSYLCRVCQQKPSKRWHPRKLTWIPQMMVWKICLL